MNGEYRALYIDALGQFVAQAHAPAISGPWNLLNVLVAAILEANDARLLNYMPRIHQDLSDSSGFVLPYSVNAWNFSDVLTNAAFYQPHYLRGPALSQAIPGDLNGDAHVNIYDLSILLCNWGTNNANSDLDGNGQVNIYDLSRLLSHWTG